MVYYSLNGVFRFGISVLNIIFNSGGKRTTKIRKITDLILRTYPESFRVGCALFYKPIWQLTVNERGHYTDSEDTFLFKIEDSPDTRLGA